MYLTKIQDQLLAFSIQAGPLDSDVLNFNTKLHRPITHNINLPTLSSRLVSNRLQAREELEEAVVDQEMVATHTEDKEAQEDGGLSLEEVDAEALPTDQADLEVSVEDLGAAAVEDQVTQWALELDQNLASVPHHSGTLLWKQS